MGWLCLLVELRESVAVVDARLFFEQSVDAGDRGGATLDEIDDPADGDHGPGELDHVDVVAGELADGEAMLDDLPAPYQKGQHQGYAEHQFKRGPQHMLQSVQLSGHLSKGLPIVDTTRLGVLGTVDSDAYQHTV